MGDDKYFKDIKNQTDIVEDMVRKFCKEQGGRSFSLQQIYAAYPNYKSLGFGTSSRSIYHSAIRDKLQILRDNKQVKFVNDNGSYTFLGDINGEYTDLYAVFDKAELTKMAETDPHTHDHLREIYERDRKVITQAKELHRYKCLINRCDNTFMTNRNVPYIEVHHIIPLFQGGEDKIHNLSTLCAHHHREAHFADENNRNELEAYLLNKVEQVVSHANL